MHVIEVMFVALLIGAVTSAISLLEVVTASVIDEWGISRRKAAVGTGTLIAIIGLWPAVNTDALGAYDALTGFVFLPAGALAMAVFVGWVMRNPIDELSSSTGPRMRPFLVAWLWVMRIIAPVLLVVVLYNSVPGVWSEIAALFGR
jgi:neurotransmitter:Na+ symporter, NSS family